MKPLALSLLLLILPLVCDAWTSRRPTAASDSKTALFATTDTAMTHLEDAAARDAYYALSSSSEDNGNKKQLNMAQYLLDLHEAKATFDFCGGMLFQLVLSDALRAHLETVAHDTTMQEQQPVLFDSSYPHMSQIPQYSKSGRADNIHGFHGRELRNVPTAAGGMGMVLQLSLATDGSDNRDPEGWCVAEETNYDGWGHDSGRDWRTADRYESEGFATFQRQFGSKAFGLNHRFYLHLDRKNCMWLSAEDGCEGTPALVDGRDKMKN